MPVTLEVNGETHALDVSPARRLLHVLREAGYVTEQVETTPREEAVHRFERARPN